MLQVTGYGKDDLAKAIEGAHLIVIPAGVPRKPGMTRDDLFNINAGIVKTLIVATAKHAPDVSAPHQLWKDAHELCDCFLMR